PEYRAKYPDNHFSNMARTLWADPTTREVHRAKMLRQREDESFLQAMRQGRRNSYERRIQANPQMMSDMSVKAAEALTRKWKDPDYQDRVVRRRIARYVSQLLSKQSSETITPAVYEANRTSNWIPRIEKALRYFNDFDELLEAGRTYNHRI